MSFQDFTKLDVWIFARKVTNSIYTLTKKFPSSEQFGLTNQMRRCAVSVPSNIAEGCGRHTTKGKLVFFYISRGSLFELETQLYISLDQNFIDEIVFSEALEEIQASKKLLNGFINYFKKLEDGK
ncbi:four helix bundle protein [Halpernia frigidisoli]|uniref:Four helix bundle protein n=1 Tax=Halpernia frigidisoli TaxID=1125876 RepID=A0A1I3J6M2_9FLAO|nr:four helix bundle protein [Halpernia frigidisoli]SFI55800.1 four helix bundle protein [Halpernia frigidisoli]